MQEYYWIDEKRRRVDVFIREGEELIEHIDIIEWTSPLLGIRIDWSGSSVRIYNPDGNLMRPPRIVARENEARANREAQRADVAEERAELA